MWRHVAENLAQLLRRRTPFCLTESRSQATFFIKRKLRQKPPPPLAVNDAARAARGLVVVVVVVAEATPAKSLTEKRMGRAAMY